MNKIILFENTEVLRFRIETILTRNEDLIVETISRNLLELSTLSNLLKDTKQLIIDIDNFEGKVDSIINEIRQTETIKKLPILLISSKPDKDLITKVAKFGNTDVLLKPFKDLELLEKVLKYKPAPLIENINVPLKVDTNFSLKWNDGYKVGVTLIDEDHKQIFDSYEKLYLSISDGHGLEYYGEILSFLEYYISSHFEREEKFQAEIAYDLIDLHKSLHDNFKAQIKQLILEQKNIMVSNQALIRLTLFIKEWLIHHILVEDKKIELFLSSQTKSV